VREDPYFGGHRLDAHFPRGLPSPFEPVAGLWQRQAGSTAPGE
jgi:hypothetical protein